jgi:ankyrin repeat protein
MQKVGISSPRMHFLFSSVFPLLFCISSSLLYFFSSVFPLLLCISSLLYILFSSLSPYNLRPLIFVDKAGTTALWVACKYGHLDIVKVLLKEGICK